MAEEADAADEGPSWTAFRRALAAIERVRLNVMVIRFSTSDTTAAPTHRAERLSVHQH